MSGEADASKVQLFPAIRTGVALLSYVWTVKESAAPTDPEIGAPATVTATDVFPGLAAVTDAPPGPSTLHCAYTVVFP